MKITLLFLFVLICVSQTIQGKTKDKEIKKTASHKENPIDTLLYLVNTLLRGDVIAVLTKIVEVVQRKDTGLILQVVLIIIHRFLTIMQPMFYIIFPSTKDQGSVVNNFKSRVRTVSHLMSLLME